MMFLELVYENFQVFFHWFFHLIPDFILAGVYLAVLKKFRQSGAKKLTDKDQSQDEDLDQAS